MELKESNVENLNNEELLYNKLREKLFNLEEIVGGLRQKNSELKSQLKNKNLEKIATKNTKVKKVIEALKKNESIRNKEENNILSNQKDLKANLIKDLNYTTKEKEIQSDKLIKLEEKRMKILRNLGSLRETYQQTVKERESLEAQFMLEKNQNTDLNLILESKKQEDIHLKQLYKIHFK